VHHFRGDAAVLGAFRPIGGVVNYGAVAMLEPRQTLAALRTHGPLIAPRGDKAWVPRGSSPAECLRASGSSPAEFVQPLVVDAEVVCDLVDDRDRDLVDNLLFVLADVEQRVAVDGDGVGQRPGI
jgi:hypothetical protein